MYGPLLRLLVVLGLHAELALLLAAKDQEVKVHIGFKRRYLSVAVHHLDVLPKSALNLLVLLKEVDRLVVDGTVHD